MRCAIWGIEFNRDIHPAQVAVKSGADNAPFKLTLSAAKGRHSNGGDSPFLVMCQQILKSTLKVGKICDGAPMVLCREVKDMWGQHSRIEIGTAKSNLFALTAFFVILEHIGEAFLELKRNPFPHDADTVDCIDKGLRL